MCNLNLIPNPTNNPTNKMSFGGALNSVTRDFGTGVRAASYWIGNRLLSASDIANDSSVSGGTVGSALNNCVSPYEVLSLADQAVVSYDTAVAKWRGRSKEVAFKGDGNFSFCIGTFAVAPGIGDIILGNSAGSSANTGSGNIGIGTDTLDGAVEAVQYMVAVGSSALSGALTSAANGTVAIGASALTNLSSGARNTACGFQAGDTLTTGSNMTLLGYDADGDNAARSGCVVIGTGATATADDTLVIRMGNTSTKELTITPVVDATVRVANTYLPMKVGATQYYIPLYV